MTVHTLPKEPKQITDRLKIFPKPDGRFSVHRCVKWPNHWRLQVLNPQEALEVAVEHVMEAHRA